MHPSQLPFLVEGLILLAAGVLGAFLGRRGRPYGQVKLGFHLFFFLWFSMGFFYVATSVFGGSSSALTQVGTGLLGLGLVVQLVSGVVALVLKPTPAWLPRVHLGSALVLLVGVALGFVGSAG